MRKLTVSILVLVLLLTGVGPAQAQSNIGDPFTVGIDLVAEGLTSPVALIPVPDGSGRLFVVDQIGLIRVLMSDGTLLDDPFLDVRDRLVSLQSFYDERGLLGLAFHPDYAENGRFFVYYSAPLRDEAPAGFNHTSHISEFTVSAADANIADATSEQILLEVDQPQFNHNAGTLAFGPSDGYLYISLGDGGGANDNQLGHVEDWYAENGGGNGQDITENLLGSILRIDVNTGDPYGIPADNPFTDQAGCADGCDEIFAYGFRNPYRFSFDMGGSHSLLAGDAGQGLWEEISLVESGGNYGWNVKEGTHCFDAENNTHSPAQCPDVVGAGHPRAGEPLIDPVIEYANQQQPGGLGTVVVAGYVYRGDTLRQFKGRYIFGDWSKGFIQPDGSLFVAKERKNGLWQIQELLIQGHPDGRLGHYVLGFGQDLEGEVYVLTTDMTGPSGNTGTIYRLIKPGNSSSR